MRCYYKGLFRDGSGHPILSGTVSVYLAGTTTAVSVYTSLASATAVNSVTGSATDGTFELWVDRFDYDQDQQFKLALSKAGYTSQTWDNVSVDQIVLGTYAIAADKTVTTHLVVPKGVIYEIATTKTLTISVPFEVGLCQVFDCMGTGKVVFKSGATERIPVQWFGALGDNATDDSAGINAAATSAAASGTGSLRPILYFPTSIGYHTESAVTVGAGVDVIMEGPIRYTGDGTALIIGASDAYNVNGNFKLNVIRATQSAWAEGSVGIKMYNCYTSKIEITEASQFQEGIQFIGDAYGFVYNEVTLLSIRDNKIGIKLTNGVETGWANENNFYGGRFTSSAGTNLTVSRNAIVITSGHAYYNNNNHFYKPSFELNNAHLEGGATSVPVLIEYGSANGFYNCRSEDSGSIIATVSNDSNANTIILGYGSEYGVTHDGTYRDTISYSRSYPYKNQKGALFNSGPLHKRIGYYNATYLHIPSVSFAASNNSNVYAAINLITPGDTYISLLATRAFGVFIDTSVFKRFLVKKDVDASYGGRMMVQAFDSAGTILTSAGGGHPYVIGAPADTVFYHANYGGVYQTGADTVSDLFFAVKDDVKKVRVLLRGGTAALRIRSFSIESFDGGSPAIWAGYEEMVPGAHLAIQSPTLGTMWEIGSVVYNHTPAASAAPGWVCVFKLATTLNGGEPVDETAMVVTSGTGTVNEDIIGVMQDDSTIHWSTIASGGGTTTLVMAAGLTDAAATGNAVYVFRFKAMASLGA